MDARTRECPTSRRAGRGRPACLLALLLLAATLAGCAGYSMRSTSTGQEGYVVYEPEPYLLRTPAVDAKGALTGWRYETVWLPNRQRGYRVRTWAGFGKADFEFSFENGWMLTGITDRSSNEEVLATLSKFLPPVEAFLPSERATPGREVPAAFYEPVLYRFDYDCDGRVCGLTAIEVGDQVLRACRPAVPAHAPPSAPKPPASGAPSTGAGT